MTSSNQSFEKLKVEYIEVARCFISDFKKSLQEGRDQVNDSKTLANQLLETFEMRMKVVDQNFVSIQDLKDFLIIFYSEFPGTRNAGSVQAKDI